jgi:hypothetical protein
MRCGAHKARYHLDRGTWECSPVGQLQLVSHDTAGKGMDLDGYYSGPSFGPFCFLNVSSFLWSSAWGGSVLFAALGRSCRSRRG